MKQMRKPTHPGKVFLEDVLIPLDLTITCAADLLGVTRKALSEFVNEKSALSPVMALRIAKATGTTVESWLAMQMKTTLWEAEQSEALNVKKFPKLKKVG
jgi:addiction module HigA family antidote